MIHPLIDFGVGALVISSMLGIFRMIKGPTVMDRILSFDTIAISIIGILLLLSMKWESEYYMDIVLIFSIFGFFGTIAFSFYLSKTYDEHPDNNSGENQ